MRVRRHGSSPARLLRVYLPRQRHHSEPLENLVDELRTDEYLGFERFDAENDELTTAQPFLEAVVIKLVLLRGEAEQVLALVSDPLSRTFAPEPRQVPFKGPQRLLPQISLLLYGHHSGPVLVVHR